MNAALQNQNDTMARKRAEVRTGEPQGGWHHAAPKQTPEQRRQAAADATGTRKSFWK